ncbi:LuxR C-terminal-related transcriptional regulator [Nonomuraea sp. MCN248]|uniref:LuxR C-terminal-related transcriptional regulator n=1 Tax=Nonomuraea corallina TaxID=2989783 RepID=A0ABT4SBI2_9ACTN|nr:LuxR C-terminal-related transcriptional regulator [Nonomuraea corallina]MDA0634558.1 LuxR C-terminal-related transcriptional regulator [Nonomuraea corallina]
MLDALGMSTVDEAVYRAVLDHPQLDLVGLAARLGTGTDSVRASLDRLVDLALVRVNGGGFHVVRPQAALQALLAKAEAEIAARQQRIEATKAAVVALATQYDDRDEPEAIRRLNGLDEVRDYLAELSRSAQTECLSLTPAGPQQPEAMAAEKELNLPALQRGVAIRNIYLDSYRNDPATLAHARWMAEHGGQSRTTATLPLRMVIIDRRIALVPIDPDRSADGALELHSPGVITALVALFEQLWAAGTPLGEAPPKDEHGLNQQERELLRLLADGHTDESAGRQLAVSTRSVQRMMTAITERLGATSRFQAGVEAQRREWL